MIHANQLMANPTHYYNLSAYHIKIFKCNRLLATNIRTTDPTLIPFTALGLHYLTSSRLVQVSQD